MAAGPGSLALAGSLPLARPTPLSPEALRLRRHAERPTRATRPCHDGRRAPVPPGAPPVARPRLQVLRRLRRQRWEDVSHRLLQPILSTGTRKTAGFPRLGRLTTPSRSGGAPVDAVSPASITPRTPSRVHRTRGGERRSGPALRPGQPVRPPGALEARLLPLPVTRGPACLAARPFPGPRAASASPPSKGAASATRSSFDRQVFLP
jgi:hypothetical protein